MPIAFAPIPVIMSYLIRVNIWVAYCLHLVDPLIPSPDELKCSPPISGSRTLKYDPKECGVILTGHLSSHGVGTRGRTNLSRLTIHYEGIVRDWSVLITGEEGIGS